MKMNTRKKVRNNWNLKLSQKCIFWDSFIVVYSCDTIYSLILYACSDLSKISECCCTPTRQIFSFAALLAFQWFCTSIDWWKHPWFRKHSILSLKNYRNLHVIFSWRCFLWLTWNQNKQQWKNYKSQHQFLLQSE